MDGVGNWADKCTLNCGSCLWGIPVRIHYTYFILWVIEVIMAAVHYHLFQYTMIVFLQYGPVLLVTLIIHEFGHSLMNRRFGGHVDHILIWPLGGFAIIGPTGGNVLEDFWVAFAGPLTHVPQIVFWVLVYGIVSGFDFSEFDFLIRFYELKNGGAGPFFKVLATQSVELNVLLIIFNLFVPAYPLDGGRCLAALLVHFGVAVLKAAYITAVTAILAAIALIIYGFYSMVALGRGTGFFFILIAIFILISSVNLYRMAKNGRVYEHPLFDRPCYRQRDGQSGASSSPNGSSTTKKKKMVKKKKPAEEMLDAFDIEMPPEAPQEPRSAKKSTKQPSAKKSSQSGEPTGQTTPKQKSVKKAKPTEPNTPAKQTSVKKTKSSESSQSPKQSTTKKSDTSKTASTSKKTDPKTGETKKATKKSSTKDSKGEKQKSDSKPAPKTEVKPVSKKTNMDETQKIANTFDDIKRKFENRKAGIYEP